MRRFARACFRLWRLAESSWTSCVRRPWSRNLMSRERSACSPPSASAQSCTACWSSTWRGCPALSPSSVGENHERKIFSQITCTEGEKERIRELTIIEAKQKASRGNSHNVYDLLVLFHHNHGSYSYFMLFEGDRSKRYAHLLDLASWMTQSRYCSEWQEGQ